MVFSKTAVDLIGLANLDMMHRVARGYDTCGLVGQTRVASGPHERGGAALTVQTATTVNLTKTGNTEADKEKGETYGYDHQLLDPRNPHARKPTGRKTLAT